MKEQVGDPYEKGKGHAGADDKRYSGAEAGGARLPVTERRRRRLGVHRHRDVIVANDHRKQAY